ncbi:5791_t:CDS:2 [Funneliformis mosseae]|uniref:5791_t:CDS:1 n=1 Tax=Funneliformis mosseae TaxID=27381 RepID=A0A9N8WCJ5_FUNMO|nr:5791_t:CDS:2 [Funneliformis mosseae]
MSNKVSIEIPPQYDETPDKGSPVSMMKFSPDGKYLVTYSEVDETFVCWNVGSIKDVLESKCIKASQSLKSCENELNSSIIHMCISNEMILAYIDDEYDIRIIDMNEPFQEIKLYFEFDEMKINIEDIRISNDQDYTCLKMDDEKIIIHSDKLGISKSLDLNDEQLKSFMIHHQHLSYFLFDHRLIWNPDTKGYNIESEIYKFVNLEHVDKFHLESSAVLKKEELIELDELSQEQIDLFNKYELDKDSIIWKIKIEGLENQKFKIDEALNIDTENFIEMISDIKKNENDVESRIKKYKNTIKEYIIKMNSIIKLDIKSDEALTLDFIELITKIEKEEKDHKKWKSRIEKLTKEFTKRITKVKNLAESSYNINIEENYLSFSKDFIRLFGAEKYLRHADKSRKVDDKKVQNIKFLAHKSINKNNIVILTEAGIFIFQLINDENLVSLSYYHMYKFNIYENIGDDDNVKLIRGWVSYVQENKKEFLKHLPHLLKFTADAELTDEIYNYVKLNREDILKYGSTILRKAIKIQASNLIEKIYNECLDLFKKDLENNNAFLSIINKSMPSLDKHYPEYIARYSSDTNMIIDSPKYKIELLNTTHLYPFSNIACFTAASTYSEDIVSEGIRNPLLKATIVLGIIHLNFELRQIYYDPIKWFIDPWNYFGDSNALPNWEYLDNPKLTILMVLFSLLIAVYLMNLLIGLLSNAIDEDNNRASYFMQKARFLVFKMVYGLFETQEIEFPTKYNPNTEILNYPTPIWRNPD